LKVWILTGDERNSQMPFSILYATNDRNPDSIRNMNYLLSLTFDDSFQKHYLGGAWLWKISRVKAKRKKDCALVVVQVRKSHRKLMRSNDWFFIPYWVIGEVDIPRDPTVTRDSSLKSDFRRIRKHSLKFEVTKDPKRFDDFYHNMYVPQINKAHGRSAYIMSYEYMRSEFQNCELLLVTKQEKYIAGILIAYEKSGPRLWSLGVRDSNPEYIKAGAIGALFYFSMGYLRNKGFKKGNFGLSRAFLRDGVLQYKRKWSQRIVNTTSYVFALKVLSFTSGTKAFLQKNPFIFENGGILNGAIFVDGDKKLTLKDFKKINKQHFHDGLSKLFIYSLQQGDKVEQNKIPPELSDRIVLRSTKDMAWRV
jgi:hypothetical protein